MAKPILIAGNWKMHKTGKESQQFIRQLEKMNTHLNQIPIILFAPYTSLSGLRKISALIQIGAQNMFHEDQGAFTGEISPLMLKNLVSHVLLGHSERRQIFKESDAEINLKIKAALKHQLEPVLCIGETLKEREAGQTFQRIQMQIEEDLKGIGETDRSKITVAYEPVWAIGTGQNATTQQAQEAHAHIRSLLNSKSKKPETVILYGGSVKPENSEALLRQPDVNGFLIGGASLKPDTFSAIIDTAWKIRES